MKRLFGQILFVAGVGVVPIAFTPACVENDQSIFVRQVMAPPQTRQNGVCSYTPDPTQAFLSEGVLDVAVRSSYSANLLVGSQLSPRGDQLNVRSETNRAHVNGAVVRVTGADGSFMGEFTSVTSGFVDPGLNNQASFGIAQVTLLDASTSARIGVQGTDSRLVIANVKVFGQTLGGVDLESGEFQFPIRICNGCLVDFSKGDDPANPGRDCNLPLTATGGTAVLPCLPGQDEPTPCQLCSSDVCKGQGP
jgi:hypothetical protein